MRRTSIWGLTIAALAGAGVASCNFILGTDPYLDAGGKTSSASSGHGGADGGASSTGGAGGTGGKMRPPGKALWAYALGTTGDDTVNAIAVAANGDILLTGKIGAASTLGCPNLSADAGGSAMGGYLIDVNDSGACQWGVLFGPGAEGTGVAVGSTGDIALTGTLTGNLTLPGVAGSVSGPGSFVARVQTGGNALWAHTLYSNMGQMVTTTGAVVGPPGAATSLDNIYFSGYADGPLNMDTTLGSPPFSGGMDGFVLSCDATGVCSQLVHLSGMGTTDQQVVGVAVNADGSELSFAGVSSGPTGFNQKAATTAPMGSGMSPDAALGSVDKTNSVTRSLLFGDGAIQSGRSVAYGGGALFFAGTYDGAIALTSAPLTTTAGTAVFLARFEAGSATVAADVGLVPSGTGMDAQGVSGLATDAAGDVVMVGALRGTASLGALTPAKSVGLDDVYVTLLTPQLKPKWFSLFGTAGSESADAVAIAKDGGIIVAGHFTMDLDFSTGNAPLQSAGMTDIFLAKLQP